MRKIYLYLIACLFLLFYSCSGMMDSIQGYLDEGEAIYVGKLDSVKVHPGNQRVEINGYMLYGMSQTQCAISWINSLGERDMYTYPIERHTVNEEFNFKIDNLSEGYYDFSIITYDSEGNRSIPKEVSSYVYGPAYVDALTSREILSIDPWAIPQEDGSFKWVAKINWDYAVIGSGVVGCDVEYELSDGTFKKEFLPAEDQISILPSSFKRGGKLYWKTAYLPDILCVDKFYAKEEGKFNLPVSDNYLGTEELTDLYLKNPGSPFQRADYADNRWGLLKDWDYTQNIVNQNGNKGGGYANNDGGIIQVESRDWGGDGFTNGKIYQTIFLPHGKYALKVQCKESNVSNSDAFLVVAAGDVMPDTDAISQSLAYHKFNNDDRESERGVEFSLTQPTNKVTIGWSISLNGPYQNISFKNIKLRAIK